MLNFLKHLWKFHLILILLNQLLSYFLWTVCITVSKNITPNSSINGKGLTFSQISAFKLNVETKSLPQKDMRNWDIFDSPNCITFVLHLVLFEGVNSLRLTELNANESFGKSKKYQKLAEKEIYVSCYNWAYRE